MMEIGKRETGFGCWRGLEGGSWKVVVEIEVAVRSLIGLIAYVGGVLDRIRSLEQYGT